MRIRHIAYFLVLYEEQNFTRAAKRCGITQPSLTASIRRFEKLIGGRLFRRRRGNGSVTEPTDLAAVVKPYFKQAHSAVEAARHRATQHKTAKRSKSAARDGRGPRAAGGLTERVRYIA